MRKTTIKFLWKTGGSLCLLFTALLFMLPNTASLIANEKEERVLTLDEFIREASAKHPRFRELLYQKAAVAFEREAVSISGDITADIEGSYGLNLSGGSPEPALQVSIEKLFVSTGTSIGADYTITGGDSGSSVFETSISQPVLNNAFGRQNRLHESIADLDADILRYRIIEAYEDFFALLMQTYLQWYSSYARLETAKSNHHENEKILAEMKKRRAKSIALTVDVEKIELKTIASKADIVRLENLYRESLRLVNHALLRDAQTPLRPELPLAYLTPPENSGTTETLPIRTMNMLEKIEKKAKLEHDYLAEELFPSTNIWLKYSVTSAGATSQSTEELQAGFTASYPLGNTQARAAEKKAGLKIEAANSSTENIKIELKNSLGNLNARMNTLLEQIELAEEQLAIARRILAAETSYYQRGRISLNDYIRAVNQVETLVFQIDDLKVELASLLVEWLRLSDKLVTELP